MQTADSEGVTQASGRLLLAAADGVIEEFHGFFPPGSIVVELGADVNSPRW
jgi:hypothetical protein